MTVDLGAACRNNLALLACVLITPREHLMYGGLPHSDLLPNPPLLSALAGVSLCPKPLLQRWINAV